VSGPDGALCCQCGSGTNIRHYSPDMDITPVPLCLLCYIDLLYGNPDSCRCPCHNTIQPGLVPCPQCTEEAR